MTPEPPPAQEPTAGSSGKPARASSTGVALGLSSSDRWFLLVVGSLILLLTALQAGSAVRRAVGRVSLMLLSSRISIRGRGQIVVMSHSPSRARVEADTL